jgi:hypothetical protein
MGNTTGSTDLFGYSTDDVWIVHQINNIYYGIYQEACYPDRIINPIDNSNASPNTNPNASPNQNIIQMNNSNLCRPCLNKQKKKMACRAVETPYKIKLLCKDCYKKLPIFSEIRLVKCKTNRPGCRICTKNKLSRNMMKYEYKNAKLYN